MSARLPCPDCRAIVPDRRQIDQSRSPSIKTPFEREDSYPAFPSVASSAQAGCSLCVLVWRRLTSIPTEAIESIKNGHGKLVWVSHEQQLGRLTASWDQKVKIQAYFDFLSYDAVSPSGLLNHESTSIPRDGHQYGGAVISMLIIWRPISGALRLVDGSSWNGGDFEFSVFDSIDLHTPQPEWRRNLPSRATLSDENVTKIQHWIDSCLHNHSGCSNARTATSWVPRRLLKINRDQGLKMQLIESSESDFQISAKFAALSRVWGDLKTSPPLRLLSSNSRHLKNGIQESELPKNFADAAHVCMRLGIQYLWVDSLCIMQDSRDDWREQAALMHLVYSHALITIVATSATCCHDGFLERNIDSVPAAKVAYSAGGGQSASDDHRYMIVYDYDNPLDIWRMHAINGSKWNTRAWTMQERSLSTRMIHFCRNKLFFECRGCLQSEENEPPQESDKVNSTLWPRSPDTSFEELLRRWELFVDEYTMRSLTVSTDKLPAIQSVAEEMAAATGQKYIQFAGMWQSNLRHELLWCVIFGGAKRPDARRAPSWSWAAVEGTISLWQRDFRNSQQSHPGTLLYFLSLHPFQVLDIDQDSPSAQSINPGFLKVRSLTKRFSHLQKHHGSGGGGSFFPYDLIIDDPHNHNVPESETKVFASKPGDPIGAGRYRNARYIDGHKPTLIKNATIWVGEPAKGTSAEDARAGIGYSWIHGDVFLEYGLIKRVEADIDLSTLSSDTLVWDAKGRRLTTGIIDMHSHSGVDGLPELVGGEDTNELSSDITPYVRSIDGINPNDYQIEVIKSGGVTTSLVLPGSGNNIGGEAFVIKHAVGQPDGRNETSAADMLADPDRTWRYIKMACGENPKRVYGKVGEHGPFSRLGESWEFRHAFEQAAKFVSAQDDWCAAADAVGVENMDSYLPQEIEWEILGAVLRGQVHVNTHCYTIPDLEAFVDHTNEFKFPVRAFHHAHQTFLVPEILKRTWGDSPPASALFADNMWYKAEAYIGSEYAGKILYENGLTPIYVSDNPVLNAQHVVFEAGKAFGYGLPYHVALASVTTAPAERLGLGNRLGKVKPGFDADVVVWDSDPLSVGATPVQVWIDGTAQYENPVELEKPSEARFDIPKDVQITKDEPLSISNLIITGVSKSGKITCLGACVKELQTAQDGGARTIDLEDGYITKPFTAFGSLIGLNAIDAEQSTDNGGSPDIFSRGVDGLALDTKKTTLRAKIRRHTRHYIPQGAVFAEDAAVHYTLDVSAKSGSTSISNAIGSLRRNLLDAVEANTTAGDPFSESAFLRKVIEGSLPLVITAQNADTIAAVLKVKSTVDSAIASAGGDSTIRLVIIGGAESFIVADELAAAGVGVVLSPFLSYRKSWDERRALTGAPLTNGTAVDRLIEAGVLVAIGLEEDWVVRDLGLLAGIAYKNGGAKIDESQALDLVGANVYKLLGLEDSEAGQDVDEFVVFEGSPLEVGARVRAVGDGLGEVKVFEYA
ncbi:hypothetical protein GQX73_g6067 [Xylaria multiplex]|uniref:Amidohydrolase 3 domain-containing protein n=1 Tax=Xylaria multiplex TaxID=323545 RepID=A0A7C8ML10_9PEZI|nr:hypothetical protein GQX73_g6067 [Xylaria multiplex]